MTKVKILDVKDLSFNEEEQLINSTIAELEKTGCNIFKLFFRQRSVIIEYYDYTSEEWRNEDYRCQHCNCSCNTETTNQFEINTTETVQEDHSNYEFTYTYVPETSM